MTRDPVHPQNGEILDDDAEVSLWELCQVSEMSAEFVLRLVDEGIIDPVGEDRRSWRFKSICIRRVRRVKRLRQDLGVNLAGAALALELLEEIDSLRRRLRNFEN